MMTIALAGGGLLFGSVGDGPSFLDVADASFSLSVRWVATMFLVSVAMTAIDLPVVASYFSLAVVEIPSFFQWWRWLLL